MSNCISVEGTIVTFEIGFPPATKEGEPPQTQYDTMPLADLVELLLTIDEGTTIHNLTEDPAWQAMSAPDQKAVRAYFSGIRGLVNATRAGLPAGTPWAEKLKADIATIGRLKAGLTAVDADDPLLLRGERR
jgi:hypothetical protein